MLPAHYAPNCSDYRSWKTNIYVLAAYFTVVALYNDTDPNFSATNALVAFPRRINRLLFSAFKLFRISKTSVFHRAGVSVIHFEYVRVEHICFRFPWLNNSDIPQNVLPSASTIFTHHCLVHMTTFNYAIPDVSRVFLS